KMVITSNILQHRMPSNDIMNDNTVGPLQDVQEAIRTVRRNASAWNLNPERIGVMGYSAGGHLAGTASTLYGEGVYTPGDKVSARPDFSILIYGVLSMQDGVTHAGSQRNLLGENPSRELKDRSGERRVGEESRVGVSKLD